MSELHQMTLNQLFAHLEWLRDIGYSTKIQTLVFSWHVDLVSRQKVVGYATATNLRDAIIGACNNLEQHQKAEFEQFAKAAKEKRGSEE
jgi:hypothetical protein